MKQIGCPSCGAEHNLADPSTISLVCEYCDNVIVWDQQGVKLSGKQSRLTEGFSRFYRGATGTIRGQQFQVLGRVRYSFGRGFWDEWYLILDSGKCVWVTEDNHEFAMQEIHQSGNQFGHFSNYVVGEDVKINGEGFRIQEIDTAVCLGIEGALPKEILPQEKYPYIDGSSFDGTKTFGLEYDGAEKNSPPTLYIGNWIKPDDIKCNDESLEW
jgi:hypothetical protein